MKHYQDIANLAADDWAKQKPLGAALFALAHDLGPDARLPTVRTLCRTFGVSTSTLDPVLRSLEQRGAIVRQHGRGIFVSKEIQRKTIGVVFGGDIFGTGFSPFWGLLLQAVREQAGGRNFLPQAYLDISQGRQGLSGQAQLVEDLESLRLDGLLLIAPDYHRDEAAELRAYGVPLVVMGGASSGWSVAHDLSCFLSLAVQELSARGCRRVALLGLSKTAGREGIDHDLRQAGDAGGPLLDWSYDTWASRLPGSESREMFALELAKRMIADRAVTPLPDGLISLDDTMTRGVITALQQAGLQPGRDLSIVTAANRGSPVLQAYAANLIQIEYDPAENVNAALTMLETLTTGGTPPFSRMLIAPRVARASSP